MATSQLPLADDLYLAAHDSARGRCLLTATTLGLGLAAALLGELVLWRRVEVRDDQVTVLDERPTADPPTSAVLEQLLRESHHSQVRDWIAFLATGVATELVERRLARAGLVRRVEKRGLLGTKVRFVPTDPALTDWLGTRIRVAATRGDLLDTPDLVLTGLVLATGLDQHVFVTLEAHERDHLFDQLRRRMPATLQHLVGHAEAAVGDAVMARRA